MKLRTRIISAALASAVAIALGGLAAWPIYRTLWLLVPAAAGLVLGVGIAALAANRRWNLLVTAAVAIAAFALSVVPVAVPQALEQFPSGLGRGLLDGLAATVLSWKQLLTLALPVESYQTMLVPVYLVFLLTSLLATTIAARAGRFAPLAAIVLVAPVAFGTIFGAADLSAPLRLGALTLYAPREIGLWIAAVVLGTVWIWWTAGADRRAALRLGRAAGERRITSGRALRGGIAAVILVAGIAAGSVVAPLVTANAREVPRDQIDPTVIIRERTSPLAAYRVWKRDAALDAAMFSVESSDGTPTRLRLAVLDEYDGIDFHVGTAAAGSFTRFPSGDQVEDPVTVTISIDEGYGDIWVPTAGLGSAPVFNGPRAADLAGAFYVNRETGAAIAVPGGIDTTGLQPGDGYRAVMSGSADAVLTSDPRGASRIDLELMPELESWIEAQNQPETAEGLVELIQRLRDRGYLSHAISDRDGERLWIERLAAEYGTQFESSAGGHSIARIEQLFAQLNAQQRLAGDNAPQAQLVAGAGDDEQFATAAALIARALGYESRVVVGVRLDGASEVPGIPACAASCTGENLAAWVEVRGDSGPWVPIDATPQLQLRPTTLDEGEQLPEFPTTPEERDAREVEPPLGVGERTESNQVNEPEPESSWILPVLRWAGLGSAALVLLALPLLFIPLAKRRRRAKRRAERDPELAALSAWQEMTGRAADAGVALPQGAGRRATAEALGTAPAKWAATQVDRAVFAPGSIDAAETQWLWAAVDADRAERESDFSFWRKCGTAFALRSYGIQYAGRGSRRSTSAADPESRVNQKESR